MQLSDLLNRLSAKERRTLAQRRLGIEAGTVDVPSLASALTVPLVITQGLLELNAAQLRILHWIANRPGLTASWSDFQAALGDRVPAELRDTYLQGLRTLALTDFETADNGGFVATYPAVRAALPPSRLANLRDFLQSLKADSLAQMVSAHASTERPTRKEERIEVIVRTLTTPESCQAVLASRSEAARDLFQWVVEHGGSVEVDVMTRQITKSNLLSRTYYGPDVWWTPRPSALELQNPLVELVRCGLVLPVSYYYSSYYGAQAFAVAEDVELASRGAGWFDRAPMHVPQLLPAGQPGATVPSISAFLRDIAHLLGFVKAGRCEFRQDGQPYKRSLTALGKLLGHTDVGYVEQLWDLAVGAGLLRQGRGDTAKYVPVQLDKDSPHQLFLRVLDAWLKHVVTSPQRPDLVQTPVARQHILELLCTVPPDTWMQRASLETRLYFHWPLVFGSTVRGGIGPSGSPSPAATPWAELGAFILARGTDADGNPIVMMPAEHQRLLNLLRRPGTAKAPIQSPALPPWDTTWTVQADRSIMTRPNARPDVLIDLWQLAKLESNHGASVFRLTADTVAGALNRGMTPAEARKLLESRARTPLPPTVLRLIDDQGQRYGRIKVGMATTYITVDDPTLLDELARDSRVKKLGLRVVAPTIAVIDAQSRDTVIATLRAAGQLPVVDEPPRPALAVVRGGKAGPSPVESNKLLAPSVVRRAVRDAVNNDQSLIVVWRDGSERVSTEIAVIDVHGHTLHAQDLNSGDEVELPLDQILAISPGDDIADTY